MNSWYSPLCRALDARERPLDFFVRDDDAGWADARLLRLLDVFEERQLPIDLAVIPGAVSESLARSLVRRIEGGALVGLHQHGWRHENHESTGRACEFGPSRRDVDVAADIDAGQALLGGLFGSSLDPIFTPPWNRCTAATAALLPQRGIVALSRDVTAGVLAVPGLAEMPVRVDWFARHRGVRRSREEWADACARAVLEAESPLGLMLHHAPMDDAEFDALGAVLDVIAAHPQVRPSLMRTLVNLGRAGQEMPCLN